MKDGGFSAKFKFPETNRSRVQTPSARSGRGNSEFLSAAFRNSPCEEDGGRKGRNCWYLTSYTFCIIAPSGVSGRVLEKGHLRQSWRGESKVAVLQRCSLEIYGADESEAGNFKSVKDGAIEIVIRNNEMKKVKTSCRVERFLLCKRSFRVEDDSFENLSSTLLL
ncbi:hypothetical protein NE237_019003 [Protea cynaroides]|uniref:Uncharacterized protein n=1 Tax=Protea cynaroides TaxID=273540 RepID=A0A9Q0QPP3_9MAGN|nr:hypothetical protein NE237_019003 [Protea cynaroides]